MIPQLRSYLLDHWPALPLGGPRPRDLSFLVQATGISKLCCFVFADEAPAPQWVARLARSPRDNHILAHEYSVITYLRKYGDADTCATIPDPLWTMAIAGHMVGIERFLAGLPMDGMIMEAARSRLDDRASAFLDLAIGWLVRSQRAIARQPGKLTSTQIFWHLIAPIERLRATALLSERELAYLKRLERRIAALAELPLPLVFKHGDFQPGNILVGGAEMNVIDWEFGAIEAPPLMDVFGFLSRMHARWHGMEEMDGYLEDYLAAFDAVFFDGDFAERSGEYISWACAELNIEPAWLPVLFGLFVVTEANKYHMLLSQRAERGYIYLLNSRTGRIGGSYAEQLARQKYIWLLGHLAEHEQRAIVGSLEAWPVPATTLILNVDAGCVPTVAEAAVSA